MIQRQKLALDGGVSVYADSTVLRDDQWQRLQNLSPRTNGRPGQRTSMSFVRQVIPSWWKWDSRALFGQLDVASPIEGYWRWAKNLRPVKFLFDPNYGDITMVAVTTGDVPVYDVNDLVATSKTVVAGTYLLVTLPGIVVGNGTDAVLRCAVLGPSNRQPSLFVYNGVTYAFGGDVPGAFVAPGTAITPAVTWTYKRVDFGPTNHGFKPDGAAIVRDRVVYYIGSTMFWSDKFDPLKIFDDALNSGGIYLGGEELESITAVAELSTSADGSPTQSVAAAWTRTHCYLLLGEPIQSIDDVTAQTNGAFGSLQVNKLNIQAGCVSQATVTRTPYGTFWVGSDDVWFMPFGSLPQRVGTALRPLLQGQPNGLEWKIHAEYFDGMYRVSLFSPGQGPNLGSPLGEQWWLDLREGPPQSAEQARWCGPQKFAQLDGPDGEQGVWCMARDTRNGADGRLYALQSFTASSGGLTTPTQGMSLCSFDTFEGRDTCSDPGVVSLWQADYDYTEGDVIYRYSSLSPLVLKLVCVQAGRSGLTEPAWDTVSGYGALGQLDDFAVIWAVEYWDGTNLLTSGLAPLNQLVNGASNCHPISMLSKEFDFQTPGVEKLMDGAEIVYAAGRPQTLNYNAHPNLQPSQRVLVPTYPTTSNEVNKLDTTWNGARIWQGRRLPPPPSSRFNALTATWECSQAPGITLEDGVDWAVAVMVDGQHGNTFQVVQIASGWYPSLTAVWQALKAAMAVVFSGNTFVSTLDFTVDASLFSMREISSAYMELKTADKLAHLFGFNPSQGTEVLGPTLYSFASPYQVLNPDIQFSDIQLRARNFGRRSV